MPEPLTQKQARQIVQTLASNGVPPEYGFSHFTAGIGDYLDVLDDEYLKSYIKDGGSAFKLLVGIYGTGKTHFLYSVRERAWAENYVVAHIALSPSSTPFHRLDYVYAEIVKNLTRPLSPDELLSDYERGIGSVISAWYANAIGALDKMDSEAKATHLDAIARESRIVDNASFGNAVERAFISLAARDEDTFRTLTSWLTGEAWGAATYNQYQVYGKIDRANAFGMIRSLVQWIRSIGYSGLVIMLDEGETSTALTSRQRSTILSNLRELIDECAQVRFKGAMVFYAVPDRNFLEGNGQVYQALNQRLATYFAFINPSGVQIDLETAIPEPQALLTEIGTKLWEIFGTAQDIDKQNKFVDETISNVSSGTASTGQFAASGYIRTFVQRIFPAFRLMIRDQRVIGFDEVREMGVS